MWSSERSPMILMSRIPLCSDEGDSSDILFLDSARPSLKLSEV